MTAAELVRDLTAHGVELWADGRQLRCRGPRAVVTAEVVDILRARRDEVLAELSRSFGVLPIPDGIEPRKPSTWPEYVRARALVVRHEHGDAAARREVETELAWPAQARGKGWVLLDPPIPETEAQGDLPDDLYRWPPKPRYAVAGLERVGVPRVEAVPRVRTGEGIGEELLGNRARWPEAALREFWALVKWLNCDARERGYAVEGRSPSALSDAERAVRETWRYPLPLAPGRTA